MSQWVSALTVLAVSAVAFTSCGAGDGVELASDATITLRSSAFGNDDSVPPEYSCDGANVSPPLSWSGAPEGTKSFVLIVDDPDAPSGNFVHWVYFNIPARTSSLPQGIGTDERPTPGGAQGRNGFRETGYGGPCPPQGTHRYFFRLYALDTTLELDPGARMRDVVAAAKEHVLAQGTLMGTYARQ